jgi:hypothetical protein
MYVAFLGINTALKANAMGLCCNDLCSAFTGLKQEKLKKKTCYV